MISDQISLSWKFYAQDSGVIWEGKTASGGEPITVLVRHAEWRRFFGEPYDGSLLLFSSPDGRRAIAAAASEKWVAQADQSERRVILEVGDLKPRD